MNYASKILKSTEHFLTLAQELDPTLDEATVKGLKGEVKSIKEIVPAEELLNFSLMKSLSNYLGMDLSIDDIVKWGKANSSINFDYLDLFSWKLRDNFLVGTKDKTSVILSKEKINVQDLNIKSSNLLLPYGPIPKLTLFNIDGKIEDSLPKEHAYDYWLIQALSLVTNSPEKGVVPYIDSFVKENKSVINKIKSFFKSGTAQLLGSGADGAAFSISDKLVLKIFKDKFSFDSLVAAENRLHKDPEFAKTEAMIYDVGEIGSFVGMNIYYCIMEKIPAIQNAQSRKNLILILEIMKNIVLSDTSVKDLQNQIRSRFNKSSIVSKVSEIVHKIVYELYKTDTEANKKIFMIIKNLEKELSLNPDWVSVLAEEFVMKYITGRRDMHTGNLGVNTNGYIRYFDAAHGSEDKELNVGSWNKKPNTNEKTVVPGENPVDLGEATVAPIKRKIQENVTASRADYLISFASQFFYLSNK